MKRYILCLIPVVLVGFGVSSVTAQDTVPTAEELAIGPNDIRIEQSIDGGYELWVRKRPEIESILLTESTEAPDRRPTTFAYRARRSHPLNAGERRILDGEFLPDDGRHFLIDSTPEPDEEFGEAFRIFIPYIVEFGYPDTRNGEVMVLDGTYLSIRAFQEPYADYRGAFRDNPFIVRVEQAPMEGPPEGNFMPDTIEAFEDISRENDGEAVYSEGPEDTIGRIADLLPDEGTAIDLVLALDTTQSMHDDMPVLQESLVEMLQDELSEFDEFRVGFMLYRDYLEDYLVRKYDFVDTYDLVQDRLNRIRVAGGRDIPEAVYEALWASVQGFEWDAPERMIIVIGDAPPHPRPRGSVTREQVFDRAKELEVSIDTIILPQ
ncbi:MAG TPA: vWA domain-containing protein [Alkalispirochaeta sp.]|nr:vWA domain-containing protein [Alkalispirochaeta sp.]